MSVPIAIPDELAKQIGTVADDRAAFVDEAVRRMLRDATNGSDRDEVRRINDVADELNREAADVLEFQIVP